MSLLVQAILWLGVLLLPLVFKNPELWRWPAKNRILTYRILTFLCISPLCLVFHFFEPAHADSPSHLPPGSFSGNYLAGRHALKMHDFPAAAQFFSQALAFSPQDSDLLNKVFVLQISAGHVDQARILAEKLLKISPYHRVAQLVVAVEKIKQGDFEKAAENLQRIEPGSVDDLTQRLFLAWCFAGQKGLSETKLGEAMAALEGLGQQNAFLGFKLFHSALISDYLKAQVRARKDYAASYAQSSASIRVVEAYGAFLRRTGRFKEALKVYQNFLKIAPHTPLITAQIARLKEAPPPFIKTPGEGVSEVLFGLASALNDEQNQEVSLVYAKLALYLRPDFEMASLLEAEIFENLEQYPAAIAAYQRIPITSPLHSVAQVQIAKNLGQLGETEKAKALLEEVLRSDPHSFQALLLLGMVLRSQEKWSEATAIYSRIIETVGAKLNKKYWSLFYFRGIAFERMGQWNKAEKDLKHALELDPDQPQVLNYFGYSLIERKENLTQALDMVKKAVELSPNDGYIVDSLGWAYYQLGDYDKASRYLERAVELKPEDPLINDHYGDVLWRLGRPLQAHFQWARARDQKPSPKDLVLIEKKLKDGLPNAASLKKQAE